MAAGLKHIWRRWKADRSGNVAMIFGLAVPVLVLLAVVAVELQALNKDHNRLQSLADATALTAAAQMRVAANEPLIERAKAIAMAGAGDLIAKMEAPDIRMLPGGEGAAGGIEVNLTARRMSFFGNLLPPGGFVIHASARAQQMGSTPLCVLGTSTNSKAMELPSGTIIARSCLVHSNKDIDLGGASLIDAAAVQATGTIKGGSPANAGVGSPELEDPLTSMFTSNNPGTCQHSSGYKVDGSGPKPPVQPGVHCRHFDIENGPLVFAPGVHHLKSGQLQLKKGARIEGENVTLIIWKDIEIKFDDGQIPLLDLSGSQGGAGEAAHWAGFALAIHPDRGGELKLNFREIRKLEGVVYAPNTRLVIPGGVDSAEVTPWTVVVAKEMRIEGGRRLQINADYAGSSVPVPNGVGNKAVAGAPVRLTQ